MARRLGQADVTRHHRVEHRCAEARADIVTDRLAFGDFEALSTGWNAVTLALNSLNRSMGMKDAYPFVLTPAVQKKLRFVHELVHTRDARTSMTEAAA